MSNTDNMEEFERCVVCGALTDVPVSMPIEWREYYVIGCGQLCVECAKKQREAAECENTLSTEQMLYAVMRRRKNDE